MISIDDFQYRRSLVSGLHYDEAAARLKGFYEWLLADEEIESKIQFLEENTRAKELLEASSRRNPPEAATPEEIAGIGFLLLKDIQSGEEPWKLSHKYGIEPSYNTIAVQDAYQEVEDRFLEPAFDYLERWISEQETADEPAQFLSVSAPAYPLEIHESLTQFLKNNPEPRKNAFIMMQFGSTQLHESIIDSIRSSLSRYGISALRADDREYHDDLFANVLTYIYGCSFGIAVFERLEEDDFNPNVSLEVGYMRAIGKPVCLLKDKTLKTLQTDLVGKLYKTFDPQDPVTSIPPEIERWLRDKEIITL